MGSTLPLFPDQASNFATVVDLLYLFFVVVSAVFTIGIFIAVFYFAVKYRRRSDTEIPVATHTGMLLEIVWSVIPFGLTMIMFGWGASIFFKESRPPDDATPMYVVGKQWMWKFQHLDGHREINELHVPVGRKVKLTMTTEDVIHSFFVPAFRIKLDVVPGKYSTLWFEPTKAGRYHLFCAEYCGTSHSGMIGWVEVMEAPEYQAWLGGGAEGGSLSAAGEKLFQQLACNTCHKADGTGRGPALQGVFGKQVQLANGQKAVADEGYVRESITNPKAKIVSGYQPIMPTFQGQVSEEQLLQLIAYVKSLANVQGPATQGGPTSGGVQTKQQ